MLRRTESTLTHLGRWSLIGMFCIFLTLPALLGVMGVGTTHPEMLRYQENRPKAEFPASPSKFSDIKRLPNRLERWFNDAMGMRSPMIRANALLRYSLGVSAQPDRVVIGRDGWLFLGDRWANTLSQHRGIDPFDPDKLEEFVESLQARSDFLKARGIPMVLVMAPDKNSIYPEYLPAWARQTHGPTRREQFAKAIVKTDIHFVDLTDALTEAKINGYTFAKTDSHWNDYGGFVGYSAMMDYIEREVLREGFRHVGRLAHKVVRSEMPGFVMPQMLGLTGEDIPEVLDTVVFDTPLEAVQVFDEMGGLVVPERNNPKWVIGKMQTRVVRCDDVADGLKVLVLRDSFTTAMSPYINWSFSETTYTDWVQEPGQEMVSLLDRQKPDLVLFIVVQRELGRRHRMHHAWSSADGVPPRERFEQSDQTVLNEDAKAIMKRLGALDDVQSVEMTEQGLKIQMRGARSRIRLNAVGSKAKQGNFIVRLDMAASKGGRFSLVFRNKPGGVEYRTCPIFPGDNSLYFELPARALKVPLLIKLGDSGGRYYLRRWEIRKIVDSADGKAIPKPCTMTAGS